MRRPRSLLVRVVEVSLGDGALAPPHVGAITDFPLSFSEPGSPMSDGNRRNAELMTVRGVLELDDIEPYEYRDDRTNTSCWLWRGLLRGDGWTATWRGERPLAGPVELTGYFTSSLYVDPGHVRGRITRVRIISEACRTDAAGTCEVIAETPSRYRDVEAAPQFHDDNPTIDDDGTCYRDTATLIDLDLHDVPPETLRPKIVPGHLSAIDDAAVWVLDAELPVVSRLDTTTNDAIEYVLPARASQRRWVAATPTGCWVPGAEGLYRIVTGSGAYRAAEGPTFAAAVSGETLLAHDGNNNWALHTPDLPPQPLTLPSSEARCTGIDHETGDFMVLLHITSRSQRQLQLVRITQAGQVTTGPALEPPSRHCRRPFLAGAPLRLFYGSAVATISSDLTFGAIEQQPRRHVDGGALGDLAWILTYRSSADPITPWWPLPEPADPASPLPRIPIFTIVEPSAFEVKASWRVDDIGSVAAQSSVIWASGGGKLYRFPCGQSPSRPEPVDVAAAITDSIAPISGQEGTR